MSERTTYGFYIEFRHIQAKANTSEPLSEKYEWHVCKIDLSLDSWESLRQRVAFVIEYCTNHNRQLIQIQSISCAETIPHPDGDYRIGTPVWVNWPKVATQFNDQRKVAIRLIRDYRQLWQHSPGGKREIIRSIQPIAPWEVRHYGLY